MVSFFRTDQAWVGLEENLKYKFDINAYCNFMCIENLLKPYNYNTTINIAAAFSISETIFAIIYFSLK